MEPQLDFKEFQDQTTNSLVAVTKTVAQLAVEDLGFQRSLSPAFGAALDKQNGRLLRLASSLIRTSVEGTALPVPQLADVDDVENNWRGVVDVIDALLERVDTSLDEYTGIIKKLAPSAAEENSSQNKPVSNTRSTTSFASRTQNILKPQLLFQSSPENDATSPFKPLLKSKPHSRVPLAESLQLFENEDGLQVYKHPYALEIQQMQFPDSVFHKAEPTPPRPFDETTAILVDTPEKVASMLAELKNAKEIAVDLEHHDVRSYVGLVSLMQISTRESDWIVDTLKPWREDLQVLNEVFADPNILKVFHGSYMDIVWLQRDLGLYVVGLFDTYHACRSLGFPQASLASLLLKYVNVQANKQYQMADWRVRPLPKHLFDYARSDTHFLLYIYDHLRNELIDKPPSEDSTEPRLDEVLRNSRETSMLLYERSIYDEANGKGPSGWRTMLRKTPSMFSKEQFAVFRAVHKWRDDIARRNDESLNYVMPRPILFKIANTMPVDAGSLMALFPNANQLVRARQQELVAVIVNAKETADTGPDMADIFSRKTESATKAGALKRLDKLGLSGAETPVSVSSAEFDPIATREVETTIVQRTEQSHFWGSTLTSAGLFQNGARTPVNEDLRLALPLPQLTAEIFAKPAYGFAAAAKLEGAKEAPAEHAYLKNRQSKAGGDSSDNVFIVKELGFRQKRKYTDDSEAGDLTKAVPSQHTSGNGSPETTDGPVDTSAEQEQDPRHAEKAQRRREKKARKRLKKEQQKAGEAGSSSGPGADDVVPLDEDEAQEPDQDDEPFDYAKADSVLHAKKRPDAARPGTKAAAAAFDPYSKSLDAPKGARRMRKEKAGKSFTFKQ